MSWNNINIYLKKFTIFTKPEKAASKRLADIIQKETNIEISERSIFVKNNTAYLKIPPIQKNEIILKKEKILFLLKTIPEKEIVDIR